MTTWAEYQEVTHLTDHEIEDICAGLGLPNYGPSWTDADCKRANAAIDARRRMIWAEHLSARDGLILVRDAT